MKVTIFYSWESDLPNNTNRGFIESVITKTISSLNRNETFELDVCLERDTQGTPGSPNIVATILDKISKSDIFIADISIVTGDGGNTQRFSPNPNVLLELGYAIGCLGWERIILFCNETYGTNEKLPFDIQQHRRIGYELECSDEKAPVRNRLENILKEGILKITDSLYETNQVKSPDLSVSWTHFNYIFSDKTSNGLEKDVNETGVLNLNRAIPLGDLEKVYKADFEKLKQVNGDNDPNWDTKTEEYISQYESFLEQFESEKTKRKYLVYQNSTLSASVTLTLKNIGLLTATDVRVKINIPDGLLVLEKWPSEKEFITKPKRPTPRILKSQQYSSILNSLIPQSSALDTLALLSQNSNRTSACYVKDGFIHLWADKLLHKHDLTLEKDSFFILAMPHAELGPKKLTGQIFCAEYDDWKDITIVVNVTEERAAEMNLHNGDLKLPEVTEL